MNGHDYKLFHNVRAKHTYEEVPQRLSVKQLYNDWEKKHSMRCTFILITRKVSVSVYLHGHPFTLSKAIGREQCCRRPAVYTSRIRQPFTVWDNCFVVRHKNVILPIVLQVHLFAPLLVNRIAFRPEAVVGAMCRDDPIKYEGKFYFLPGFKMDEIPVHEPLHQHLTHIASSGALMPNVSVLPTWDSGFDIPRESSIERARE